LREIQRSIRVAAQSLIAQDEVDLRKTLRSTSSHVASRHALKRMGRHR